MQTTRATQTGSIAPQAGADGKKAETERSKAWASAIEQLPHPLHLYKNKFDSKHEPTLQRVVLLADGSPIKPDKWASLDRTAREEIVHLLNRTGVSVGELAPRGSPRKKVPDGAQDGFSKDLDLNWTRLVDDLPFNLFYNTVNPGYIPAEHRPDVARLAEQVADTSPLDLPEWKSLAPTVQQALIYRRIRFQLDPNGKAPVTRDEWKAMQPEARREVLALLQASGFGLAHFQRPKARESHAGRSVMNVAPGDSAGGDERQYELSSAVVSYANIVTPVVSRAFVDGADKDVPGTFDFERNRIVDEAQNFVVTRYYGFERQDYADKLISAAKRGVKVEIEMHPPETATRRRAQQAALDKLQRAIAHDPKVKANLSVAESTILPHDPEKDYPQIMHEKSVIADTPDGTLVELEGGINGGNNSPNNLDYAMRIEGSAVHDALRKYLSYRAKGHSGVESIAEQVIQRYPRAELEKRVTAKAKRDDQPLVKVELGGGGRRRVPQPETYTTEELQRRAEAGMSINLGIQDVARFTHLSEAGNPRWGLNDAMFATLETALANKSAVTITIPTDDESIDRDNYLAIKEATGPLRKLGALVCWDDTVVRDVSYKNLVYDNLDLAKERLESCEIAAFALTDKGVMERVVNLHRALQDVPEDRRPPVKVAVHELEIDDTQVNQKVVALSTAGVDVRVFTDKDAVAIAQKLGREMNMRISPEDIKLHAKGMLLGRVAAEPPPVDPRAAHGSANFSNSGFERNVEGGRFYHHPTVAQQIQERVFEEVFELCRPIEKFDLVPLALRQGIFQKVPLDTAIEDLSFMGFDLETTSYAAHFGEVPVEIAAMRESLQKTENPDGTVTWSRGKKRIGELNTKTALGFNAFGSEQKVPKQAAEIHGLTRDKLEGEPSLHDGLVRFRELAQREGKVAIPLAHNFKFDGPFIDTQYAKPEHAIGGLNHEAVDVPSVCTMELAKRALPFKKKDERGPDEAPQSYSLKNLGQQLAGRTQSDVHEGFEDTDIALDLLVALANKLQARTLRDLLPEDKLYLDLEGSEFTMYANPKGDQRVAEFSNQSDPRVATTHGRNLKDGQPMLGAPRKVYEHRVLGSDGNRVEVELATSKGKEPQLVRGWVDADQVRFYQGGETYWGLREAGHDLRAPWQVSRGEFWRDETEKAAIASQAPKPEAKKMDPTAKKSDDPKLAAIAAQLELAEDSLARAREKSDAAEAEARKLGEIADEARRFADTASEQLGVAESRVETLRAMLERGAPR